MDNNDSGSYDTRGYWHPPNPASFSPLWEKPRTLKGILTYIFGWGGFLWPRNAMYAGLAVFTWYFLQPGLKVTAELEAGWMGLMLLRNIVLMWIIFGSYHLFLYTLKLQGRERKYNPSWLERNNKKFLFNNQLADNMFMSTVSGGLIWTGYEILYIWAASNGFAPFFTWARSPVWFIAFFLLIPFLREAHFYFIHRLIHWRPLFKSVHYLHHKHVSCNFGTGTIPLDRWFGRFYNGEGKYPYTLNWAKKKRLKAAEE